MLATRVKDELMSLYRKDISKVKMSKAKNGSIAALGYAQNDDLFIRSFAYTPSKLVETVVDRGIRTKNGTVDYMSQIINDPDTLIYRTTTLSKYDSGLFSTKSITKKVFKNGEKPEFTTKSYFGTMAGKCESNPKKSQVIPFNKKPDGLHEVINQLYGISQMLENNKQIRASMERKSRIGKIIDFSKFFKK